MKAGLIRRKSRRRQGFTDLSKLDWNILSVGKAATLACGFCIGLAGNVLANDRVIFQSCLDELKLDETACNCIVTSANTKLTENQMEMFLIILTSNEAELNEARASGKLDGEDMIHLTNFMSTAPDECKINQ